MRRRSRNQLVLDLVITIHLILPFISLCDIFYENTSIIT